jgi:hypothetical protein
MRYILLPHIDPTAWPHLPKAARDRWLPACRPFDEALVQAGVLQSRNRLKPAATAATVRVVDGTRRSSPHSADAGVDSCQN